MKDGPLGFHVVLHNEIALAHNLEIGPFYSDLILPSALGTLLGLMRSLGSPGKY